MATIEIQFKSLREAVAALNETNLIKEKIKLVGQKKEDILQQFMSEMDNIPNDAEGKFPGPKIALDFYNGILDAEEKARNEATSSDNNAEEQLENTEKAPPKETPAQVKNNKLEKEKVIKAKNSEKKDFVFKLIEEGKFNKKEIIEKTLNQFKEIKESSVVTMLSDGKNPKYNPFTKLIKVDDKGIFSFV